jgi:fumarate reductase subunit D
VSFTIMNSFVTLNIYRRYKSILTKLITLLRIIIIFFMYFGNIHHTKNGFKQKLNIVMRCIFYGIHQILVRRAVF